MPDFFSALCRLFGRLGPFFVCLALLGRCGTAFAAPTSAASGPGLVIEACGALAPDSGDKDGLRAARLVRPGETLVPGDQGFGCRFTAADAPKGGAVPVEIRLIRPAPAGGEGLDRWFVAARGGTVNLAGHLFDSPAEAAAGPWTLEFYRDDRLVASRRFEMAAASEPSPAASHPAAEPPIEVVPPPEPEPAKPAAPTAVPPVSAPEVSAATRRSARAARPVAAGAPPEQRAAPAATTGYYAWQTGLFADAANADGQAAKLRRQGFPACVAVEQGKGGRRYRVLAGRYGDRKVAVLRRSEVTAAAGGGTVLYRLEPATVGRLRCH